MIVRDSGDCFTMVAQHDHALLSGEIAARIDRKLFLQERGEEEVRLAIAQHDRGWIPLDKTPVWNDKDGRPFSFMDYPLPPKLVMYRIGIDEVEAVSRYAALLCSRHYASFSHLRESTDPDCMAFTGYERERRAAITADLGAELPDEATIDRHVALLQLCDELSLYVCMNEPGATKEEEHPWYRNGFESTLGGIRYHAAWTDRESIRVTPGLFAANAAARIAVRRVAKSAVEEKGIGRAYRDAPAIEQFVTFSNGLPD